MTGWSDEELAIIRQREGVAWLDAELARNKWEPDREIPDRLPAVPGQPSIEHPEVWPATSPVAVHDHDSFKLELARIRGELARPRSTSPARPPWRPDPEPLEGPDHLSYERIVRLEWECGIRSGTVYDWINDKHRARILDIKMEST